ncbi:MAG: hypothetical protein HWN68_21130 [Desulfobacterales bacterium]|nr:hypothetical protein [Desulfobacterales bacterium]
MLTEEEMDALQLHPLKQHGSTHQEGIDPIPPQTKAICFNFGTAAVGTKLAQVLIPFPVSVVKVKIYGDTAPTGASLIVDVNKNGTTIFTTQANRPEIAIGENSDDSELPDVRALAEGDRLSIDIDQVGSTIPGGDDFLVTVII